MVIVVPINKVRLGARIKFTAYDYSLLTRIRWYCHIQTSFYENTKRIEIKSPLPR